MKKTVNVAFCGIITALSAVLMMLTGIFTFSTYALPAIAGLFTALAVIEISNKWGWLVYAATSLLSVILPNDKEAVLLYILFFGFYPILKSHLEKIKSRALEYMVKFLIFNACVIAATWLATVVLGIPLDMIDGIGKWTIPLLLALGNITFLLYDFALTGVISQYLRRFHPRIHKFFR